MAINIDLCIKRFVHTCFFQIGGKILTGMSIHIFLSFFLCNRVISEYLREVGKTELNFDLLNISVINGEMISLFSTSSAVM